MLRFDKKLFEVNQPSAPKRPESIEEVLALKQFTLKTYEDFETAKQDFITASLLIGNNFTATESFIAELRKAAAQPNHESVFNIAGSPNRSAILALCRQLKDLGILQFYDSRYPLGLRFQLNPMAIDFITKRFLQYYIASFIKAVHRASAIYINTQVCNTYDSAGGSYFADILYLENGTLHCVLINMNSNILNVPTPPAPTVSSTLFASPVPAAPAAPPVNSALLKLKRTLLRYKRSVTIICASDVSPAALKYGLLKTLAPNEGLPDFQVMTMAQYLGSKPRS